MEYYYIISPIGGFLYWLIGHFLSKTKYFGLVKCMNERLNVYLVINKKDFDNEEFFELITKTFFIIFWPFMLVAIIFLLAVVFFLNICNILYKKWTISKEI